MKLRVLGFVAVMALLPAGSRAQVPPCCTPLTQAQIDRVFPVLQVEANSAAAFWWDQRAARGMSKTDYVALKNSLLAARLDAANAARISALPFDDGSRATRQANAVLYRANAAKLSAILTKVHADGGCGAPCTATPPAPAAKNR